MAKKPAPKNSQKKPQPPVAGRPAGLFTWIVVGTLVAVIAVLVVVKVSTGTSSTSPTGFQAASPAVVAELTGVPASVFDSVGVNSPAITISKPNLATGQTMLTSKGADGVTRPTYFYLGSEYCPFCAAQRWPTIVALSRFGTWSGLGASHSAEAPEAFPNTPTFTFQKATYTSSYINFKGVEEFTNIRSTDGKTPYVPLMKLSKADVALVRKYDTATYIPGMPAQDSGSIPFISIGNQFLSAGSSITPDALQGLSRSDIAAALSDPTNFLTQGIITAANYQTAAICKVTGQQPAAVCTSSGVVAAKKALGLK